MKKLVLLRAAILVSGVIMLVSACSFSGPEVSIEDRIKDFESDIRSDSWGSLSSHIHPDNGKKSAANDREYWENRLDGTDYNLSSIGGSGDNRNVDVDNNNSPTVYHPAADTWRFKMKEHKDGPLARSSWYINGITSGGGTDPLP